MRNLEYVFCTLVGISSIPRFIHDLYLYNYIIIYHVPVKRYANNKKHPSNHCILTK